MEVCVEGGRNKDVELICWVVSDVDFEVWIGKECLWLGRDYWDWLFWDGIWSKLR